MDHIAYMKAWLRLNTQTDVAGWTEREVIESWALLPLPSVSLPEWDALVNGAAEEPEPEVRVDPLEKLKRESGHLFEAGIVKLGA